MVNGNVMQPKGWIDSDAPFEHALTWGDMKRFAEENGIEDSDVIGIDAGESEQWWAFWHSIEFRKIVQAGAFVICPNAPLEERE